MRPQKGGRNDARPRHSRDQLRPDRTRGDELVDIFSARLFDAAPAVEPLFAHTDLRKQKAMLLATLVLLRKSLRDLDAIAPKLRQLGARHVASAARPEHYPVVADMMLASMAEIAGEAWTSEIEAAWAGALNLVATAMLEGAEEAEAELHRRQRPHVSTTPAVSPA